MALLPVDNADRLVVRSNVMGQNQASLDASAVYLVTVSQQGLQMVQNVIDGNSAVALVRCDGTEYQVSPSNRLRNGGGRAVSGACVSPKGQYPGRPQRSVALPPQKGRRRYAIGVGWPKEQARRP